ncbi:MAG: flagellar biosynthetic protein FliO [Proteobacteria bacterium]|nr:flagellar biosynthetic protein FliO [Pseudomonadota bacterium]
MPCSAADRLQRRSGDLGWGGVLIMTSLAAGFAPGSARALEVTQLVVGSNDTHRFVRIGSSEQLGSPRIRSFPGRVKVWFPDVKEDIRMRAPGDGVAIARASLWPGYGRTLMLAIHLADGRQVPSVAVGVERDGNQTRVLIPREHLRSLQASKAIERPELQIPEPPAAAPANTPNVGRPGSKQKLGAGDELAKTKTKTKRIRRIKRPPLSVAADDSGSSQLTVLLWISAILAGVLLAVKVVQKRRGGNDARPEIEVVASRRLGTGFQLLVVRAFGRDHLLSIAGRQVQNLATVASAREASEPASTEAQRPEGEGFRPRRDVLGAASNDEANLQGLLALARKKPDAGRGAVAGLVRLRERLGR